MRIYSKNDAKKTKQMKHESFENKTHRNVYNLIDFLLLV